MANMANLKVFRGYCIRIRTLTALPRDHLTELYLAEVTANPTFLKTSFPNLRLLSWKDSPNNEDCESFDRNAYNVGADTLTSALIENGTASQVRHLSISRG